MWPPASVLPPPSRTSPPSHSSSPTATQPHFPLPPCPSPRTPLPRPPGDAPLHLMAGYSHGVQVLLGGVSPFHVATAVYLPIKIGLTRAAACNNTRRHGPGVK
eukprot:3608363-Pyramimonas_sp.AAC.1